MAEVLAEVASQAGSIDMSGDYQKAIEASCPDAAICSDTFYVVRLGHRAVDPRRLRLGRARRPPSYLSDVEVYVRGRSPARVLPPVSSSILMGSGRRADAPR